MFTPSDVTGNGAYSYRLGFPLRNVWETFGDGISVSHRFGRGMFVPLGFGLFWRGRLYLVQELALSSMPSLSYFEYGAIATPFPPLLASFRGEA